MKAVVTGHSRGLGAAISGELIARGVTVLGISRGSACLPAPAAAGRLLEVALDLGDSEGLSGWLASGALAGFLAGAECALLVNNAGLLQPIGAAGSLGATAIARALAVNVTAPLLLADAFIAATAACADRRILHVSSGAARQPYAGWSVYCASKAALDQHARAVQQDALPRLAIASVAPGVVDTAMQAEIRATAAERFPLRDRFVELKAGGHLSTPAAAAAKLVACLLGDAFGREAVTDLRQIA